MLKAHSADFRGIDHQIDTYFKVSYGRLKLREGNIENVLIFYEREDKKGPKQSDIILYKTGKDPVLKEILERALGVLIVIDKKREIYFIGNIKFHIDTVKNLGTFIEIEAIDIDGTFGKTKLFKQCQNYIKLFGISENDLASLSYSDLILQAKGQVPPEEVPAVLR